MIAKLKRRGALITAGKFAELKQVDRQITQLKEQQMNRLIKPVAAFITFETQEGYERACNIKPYTTWSMKVKSTVRFMGTYLYFNEATEPTNIIWENRGQGGVRQLMKKIGVALLIGLFLFGCMIIFYFLKRTTITNQKRYPPQTNCQLIDN